MNSAATVVPNQVYMGTSVAISNGFRVLNHAEMVASVMISTNNNAIGVARTQLNAGGYAVGADLSQNQIASTMNYIATRNGGDIAAINFSEGIALDGGEGLDGTSHLSQFVDWSAAQHMSSTSSVGEKTKQELARSRPIISMV